jgi:8-oxo-dGTP diphosphatase
MSIPTDWTQWQPSVRATLMFIVDEPAGRALLIRKKRGLGAGKINGPGGKIEPGETAEQGAVRETQEELGITPLDPKHHGELWFQFSDGLALHAHVFRATAWEGEPMETDEAVPQWTPLDALPFHEMWADDALWLGQLLINKKHFIGRFDFDGEQMLSTDIQWL